MLPSASVVDGEINEIGDEEICSGNVSSVNASDSIIIITAF